MSATAITTNWFAISPSLPSRQVLHSYMMNLASNKLLLTFMILLWSKWLSRKLFHWSSFFFSSSPNCFSVWNRILKISGDRFTRLRYWFAKPDERFLLNIQPAIGTEEKAFLKHTHTHSDPVLSISQSHCWWLLPLEWVTFNTLAWGLANTITMNCFKSALYTWMGKKTISDSHRIAHSCPAIWMLLSPLSLTSKLYFPTAAGKRVNGVS